MAAIMMSMASTFVLTTVEFDVIGSRRGTEGSRTILSLSAPHCVEPCGELPESSGEAGGWQSSPRHLHSLDKSLLVHRDEWTFRGSCLSSY